MDLEYGSIYKLYTQKEEVSLKEVEGKKVIWNKQQNTYYQLGEIGLVIWGYFAVPVTLEQIVTRLMDEFEVIETECRRQVQAFMEELLNEGLISKLD
ncbi:PqqD family peptide modification chaperone [Niallia taxi]|uniref:PqqD family peptide modification chaperone n=1 Tax=Niallia taxi TaxID=2499688 RepID=UPI0039827FAD